MKNLIKRKKVLVLGLARSGRAAVRLLIRAGAAAITANDSKDLSLLQKDMEEFLGDPRIEIVGGGHPLTLLEEVSVVIKSPGINPDLPLLKCAREKGVPVFSEVELAYHFTPARIVGITGTNGKTTTTSLTGEMFRQGFSGVYVAGNIGFPLCEAVLEASEGDLIVAELSSFQLEDTERFRAHIAAVLNLSSDHLDYHKTIDNYVAAKRKILFNQDSGDWAVLNWDDPRVKAFAPYIRGQLLPFSRKEELREGVCIKGNEIVVNYDCNAYTICSTGDVKIPGLHNLENALAAVAIAWAGGVAVDNIARSLRTFPGVPHRLEPVEVILGVKFVNDSKGTNPDATLNALQAVKGPKVLIAGGLNKGSDFGPLVRALEGEEVKSVVLLGETAPIINSTAHKEGYFSTEIVPDLQTAVIKAFSRALPGDTVLLSPACASWDMFKNFEERGEVFKSAVLSLKEALRNEKSPHRT